MGHYGQPFFVAKKPHYYKYFTMANLINPITHAIMLEISGLDVTQINPADFANFNKIQLLAFNTNQINSMTGEQKLAYDTAINEKPDQLLHFVGPT
jgi:hypothetical protein